MGNVIELKDWRERNAHPRQRGRVKIGRTPGLTSIGIIGAGIVRQLNKKASPRF